MYNTRLRPLGIYLDDVRALEAVFGSETGKASNRNRFARE